MSFMLPYPVCSRGFMVMVTTPLDASVMPSRWQDLFRNWHDDLLGWLLYDGPKFVAVILTSIVLVRLLHLITKKIIALSKRESIISVARTQQIQTVTQAIHSAGVFLVVFIAVLQVLPLFRLDIKPLLTSAGILGLTIGFGAQTVVKDVINGLFILLENQFEVGETIKAAGLTGVVEEITMRHTALRDGDGTLHWIPNSALQIVGNMSRDWSQVVLQVTADCAADSDQIVQTLKDVAKSVYENPDFKSLILSEPEIPGIEKFTGQEITYLMLMKVGPGQQYAISRELRRRIKIAFEEKGIKTWTPAQMYIGQLPRRISREK